jgi:hypothetical protein
MSPYRDPEPPSWRTRLREWWYWNGSTVKGALVIILLSVLLIGAFAAAVSSDNKRKRAACAKMWTLARTSADSIAVVSRCELGEESSTTVVPVPVIISGGRR